MRKGKERSRLSPTERLRKRNKQIEKTNERRTGTEGGKRVEVNGERGGVGRERSDGECQEY